jgi:hypothetical protein
MTFKTIDLNLVLEKAKAETIAMIESEIDISDSSIITPLEALANEYPEMASTCNSILLELINEQINSHPITDQPEAAIDF